MIQSCMIFQCYRVWGLKTTFIARIFKADMLSLNMNFQTILCCSFIFTHITRELHIMLRLNMFYQTLFFISLESALVTLEMATFMLILGMLIKVTLFYCHVITLTTSILCASMF